MQPIPAIEAPQDATDRCDQISYQFTGAVQSHALFVVVDPATGTDVQATENAATLLGTPAESLIGEPVEAIGRSPSRGSLRNLVADSLDRPPRLGPTATLCPGVSCTRHHRPGSRVFIRFEPSEHPAEIGAARTVAQLPALREVLSDAETESEAASTVARVTRAHLGYDRCMVYRYDAD